MATPEPQAGEIRSETAQSSVVSYNSSLIGTEKELRNHSVPWDTDNAATNNMTKMAHCNIARRTRSNKNKK